MIDAFSSPGLAGHFEVKTIDELVLDLSEEKGKLYQLQNT